MEAAPVTKTALLVSEGTVTKVIMCIYKVVV